MKLLRLLQVAVVSLLVAVIFAPISFVFGSTIAFLAAVFGLGWAVEDQDNPNP